MAKDKQQHEKKKYVIQTQEIDQFLKNHSPVIPLQNYTQWDGFVTAWVSIPEKKTVNELVETIFGRAVISQIDSARLKNFKNKCQKHINFLNEVFESGEYYFMPIFVNEREDRFEDIQDFCKGYVHAVNLFKEEMFTLAPKFKSMIQEIVTISEGESAADDLAEGGGLVPANIGLVSYNVDSLYEAWRGYIEEDDFNKEYSLDNVLMSDKEYERSHLAVIDGVLKKYASEFSLYNAAAVDGFMTGLLSGPELIKPSEWLPEIWGGEEFSPAWESEKEFQEFFSCVVQISNENAQILADDPGSYTPMISIFEKGEHPIAGAMPWCSGYVKAIKLRQEDWESIPEEFMEYLNAIITVGTGNILDKNDNINLSKEEEASFMEAIIDGPPLMYEYWHAPDEGFDNDIGVGANEPFIRQEKKVGRNDPCLCGSGKKYKKCCGGKN